MKTITESLVAAVLATGLASGAYAQSTHGGHGAAPAAMPGSMPNMAAEAASTKDFKDADMRMMTNMEQPYTGDPDVDFRVHMIPHHQGAVDMAKVALKYAKDAETKKMAESIIKDQEREVGEMQAWLKKHGK